MPEFNSPILSSTRSVFLFNCRKSGKETKKIMADVAERGRTGKLLNSFPSCTLLWEPGAVKGPCWRFEQELLTRPVGPKHFEDLMSQKSLLGWWERGVNRSRALHSQTI